MRLLLCLILLVGSVSAQDGARIHRHRMDDTTRVENKLKINRRDLTVDIDSTGLTAYGWDDCFVKIRLRAKASSLTFYEEGMINGYPSIEYGNENFHYRYYRKPDGNVEFDLIIFKKPANGKYWFDFEMETQGVRMHFQPPLTQEQIDAGWIRPDSVVGSYSIYRLSGANNRINLVTGEETHYGTGKFGHLYRPLAWGAIGDTVVATMRINELLTRMRIKVDSAWFAQAETPVVIDPTIGNTTSGASASAQNDFEHNIQYNFTSTPGVGTIVSATAFTYVTVNDGTNEWVVHAFTDPDAGNCATTAFLATSSTATVTRTDVQNEQRVTMSGSFAASTAYVVVWQGRDTSNRLRFRHDAAGFGEECELADTDLIAPTTMTGCGCGSSQDHSVYITYTTPGTGEWYAQNTTNITDTWLNSASTTTNYGTDTVMFAGDFSGSNVSRSTFVLTGLGDSIGTDQTIVGCSLVVFAQGITFGSGAYDIHQLRRNPVETEATWIIWKTSNNWGTAGAANTSTDYFSTAMSSVTIGSVGNYKFHIDTSVANAALQGSDTLSVMIRVPSDVSRLLEFTSSEAGANQPAFKFDYIDTPTDETRRDFLVGSAIRGVIAAPSTVTKIARPK